MLASLKQKERRSAKENEREKEKVPSAKEKNTFSHFSLPLPHGTGSPVSGLKAIQ
jgi:hypothetical protein